MSELNNNILILAAVAVGVLFVMRAVVQGWHKYDLTGGKTVLITGGSRGLGLVMARELVRQGTCLAICARNEAELEQADTDLIERGADVLAVPCDVTDIEEMVHVVRDRFGQIDVPINNAGAIAASPMEVIALEDYEAAMKIHTQVSRLVCGTLCKSAWLFPQVVA